MNKVFSWLEPPLVADEPPFELISNLALIALESVMRDYLLNDENTIEKTNFGT